MDKMKLGAGVVTSILLLVFAIALSGAIEQPQVTATDKVQGDKRDLFKSAQNLCASKKQESLDSIVSGTGSAEQLGRVIDQLSTDDGCFRFTAEVLLAEIEVKK